MPLDAVLLDEVVLDEAAGPPPAGAGCGLSSGLSTISFRKSKAFISQRSVCTIAVDEGFGKIKRLDTSSETMISPWKTLEDLCCSRLGLLYFWVFSMFPLYRRSPTPADWITGQMTMDYRSSDSLSDRFSSRMAAGEESHCLPFIPVVG